MVAIRGNALAMHCRTKNLRGFYIVETHIEQRNRLDYKNEKEAVRIMNLSWMQRRVIVLKLAPVNIAGNSIVLGVPFE